jgi:8-amino-7-oxononanoate synthase
VPLDLFASQLRRRRAAGLYRERRVMDGPQGPEMRLCGIPYLTFNSNDYLGLAADPRLIEALRRGAARYGVGSGAAHLISGHMQPHHALEEELAEFLGRPRALLFSTGYMANQGVISGLLGAGDAVWQDRLNHASLIDGGLASRARFRRYPHADLESLERKLERAPASGLGMLVSDGVFSMDGDLAPLPGLLRLSQQYQLLLLIDDAHGIGVIGEQGRGSFEHHGVTADANTIFMGTLGKGLGAFGAFVAAEAPVIEMLIQHARSYIYTTALPPAVAQAARAAVRIVRDEPWRRQRLAALLRRFRAGAEQLGLPLLASQTPIQPVLAGSAERALRWSEDLRQQGILVSAIRPPTVPPGSARLRITFSAAHSEVQVDRLLTALERLWRREGGDAA